MTRDEMRAEGRRRRGRKGWAFCRWCGVPFWPRSSQARTCSPACSRQVRTEYGRRYAVSEKGRERGRASTARFADRNPELVRRRRRENMRRYRKENPEKFRERDRQYRKSHADEIRTKKRLAARKSAAQIRRAKMLVGATGALPAIACKSCGKRFVPSQGTHKYCTARCEKLARQARYRQKERPHE